MKKLSRDEMKNLTGGVSAPNSPLPSGWVDGTRYYQGHCYCDYTNGVDHLCDFPCPVSNCGY